jgi:hypothetical protein
VACQAKAEVLATLRSSLAATPARRNRQGDDARFKRKNDAPETLFCQHRDINAAPAGTSRPHSRRAAERRPRQKARGIERRQRRVGVADDQRNLGAAQHDGIAASTLHPLDDAPVVENRLRLEDAADELIHDDAVDLLALLVVRTDVVQAVRPELCRIDLALDQPARADESELPVPAQGGLGGDDLGDVEPGARRPPFDRGKRPVDGVVGANQEIGADRGQLLR